ncbi:MAG TPA: serine hydrolase [Thermoanaerobaculia bacterium]|nr:serine hydrolase [Thermoanaerobaculia bacterium]
MKRFALFVLLLAGCATTPASRLDRIIAAHPGKTIAVAYYDFGTGATLLRNERERFHAASTMKVPVMLGIFEAATRGELSLDQPVRVKNEFTSIFDGSTYALEAREDSDAELYTMIGKELPLRELVRRMEVRSSNLATNIVIELIGAKRVMRLMQEIGANDIQVLRGVEDDKAYHAGMNNTTTAYDLMLVFRTVARSPEMVDILAAQEHNDGIPAGLPPGTRVAHKTGWIPKISHDAGIVYRPDGSQFILVVLTRGFEKSEEANRVIAAIARTLY